ncbi:hypothetical protein BVRB_1g005500 [Beta vulgaris subsp. vulgaris]|nr:hypothetical protein BVRB_1g005500 [Beta vulgaris subsp. vulgaris]
MSSSTTTTSDDDAAKPRRLKLRKVAIFFAYCGVGYQGMQKNPGAKTIESDLEEALYLSGAVPEADRGQPKRFDFARSARTDKGVSAVGQVVSGRFYVDPPGFVHRLNSNLSPQIRVFGFKRATPSFNAKKFCDRRRYVYLLPVFALDGNCHRDRESVMASLGSGNELVKCFGCSERGRKVVGLMGNRRDWEFCGGVDSGVSSNGGDVLLNGGEKEGGNGREGGVLLGGSGGVGGGLGNVVDSEVSVHSGILSSNGDALLNRGEEEKNEGDDCNVSVEDRNSVEEPLKVDVSMVDSENFADNNVVSEEASKEIKSDFKYGEEEKKRFNRILKHYEGTHNFHNFTTRTKAEDPSAKRYIVSFEANTTFTIEGIEFVKCEVIGQSFMLHQIRKMMGLAVAVMRNFTSELIYDRAFDQDFKINVPTAPEVGLYLDECFFTSYNNKWKNTHEELSMKDYAEEAEEFKMKYIYSHVGKTEDKEGSVAVWLHSLNHRNYPDLRYPNDEVEKLANDEVEKLAGDEVKEAATDEVERVVDNEVAEAGKDGVAEAGKDGVVEAGKDGVAEAAKDGVAEAAKDGVAEAAKDKVAEAAKDEVESAVNNELVEAAKDEVERTANGEVERPAEDQVKRVAEGEAMDVLP